MLTVKALITLRVRAVRSSPSPSTNRLCVPHFMWISLTNSKSVDQWLIWAYAVSVSAGHLRVCAVRSGPAPSGDGVFVYYIIYKIGSQHTKLTVTMSIINKRGHMLAVKALITLRVRTAWSGPSPSTDRDFVSYIVYKIAFQYTKLTLSASIINNYGHMLTVNALITLRVRAVWSGPSPSTGKFSVQYV